MARKMNTTTKVLMLATMAAAWAPAYAADANPADVAQADKFLAKLPSSCAASSKSVASDGTVNITIKCDGNGKKMDGVVAIKDGIVTKVE